MPITLAITIVCIAFIGGAICGVILLALILVDMAYSPDVTTGREIKTDRGIGQSGSPPGP